MDQEMVSWNAFVPFPSRNVGCFDPAMILHRMEDFFGSDVEFDRADLLSGHFERTFQTATELGLRPNSPVLASAAKLVREVSPRYEFRLRVGEATHIAEQVDRYQIGVRCEAEADFPLPMRSRFMDFLATLQLGQVIVEVPVD
jgi:hypothetical protein